MSSVRLTDKQRLAMHMADHHNHYGRVRATQQQLAVRHKDDHDQRPGLPHTHRPEGWFTGGDQIHLVISLAPPKNPGSQNRQERNWVLVIAKRGQNLSTHFHLAGTHANDPAGAQAAANIILGYQAPWFEKGWGFQVQTTEKISDQQPV